MTDKRETTSAISENDAISLATYFEPVSLQINGKKRALINGSIFINSPAVSAYAEARE